LTPPLVGKGLGEALMELEIGILGCDRLGHLTRLLQHLTIVGQAGERQIGEPRLAGAQDLAWTTQPQIHFGYFKTITRANQHLKPLFGLHVVAVVDE
jgi:hypothetical protein